MAMPSQPWRSALQPASFGGAGFHVEVDSQGGGRRNAFHEFPHRDTPWAEDMGRKGRRWNVTAYIIGPTYIAGRNALIAACEKEGPLSLVHPSLGTVQASCEGYTATERRELGGYVAFELNFLEAGSNPGTTVAADTQSQVSTAATSADAATANAVNTSTGGSGGIGSDTVAAQAAGAGSIASTTPLGGGIGRN